MDDSVQNTFRWPRATVLKPFSPLGGNVTVIFKDSFSSQADFYYRRADMAI
jgi:hypothetical protein